MARYGEDIGKAPGPNMGLSFSGNRVSLIASAPDTLEPPQPAASSRIICGVKIRKQR